MSVSRILVVRLGAMGDIIHTLPAVASLRQMSASKQVTSHLTWAVEERWAPLLAHNPYVDEIAVVDRHSLRAILALRSQLRAGSIQTAIDFQGLLKSSVVASLARPAAIWGWHSSAARERMAAMLYTRTLTPTAVHVVDRNLELAAAAGGVLATPTFPIPMGQPEGDLPSGPFVLANPFAGWAGKQWPLEYYSQLGHELSKVGFTLVLNGPEPICAPHTEVHVSGIPGLIDATRRATAVVGADSGPLHLAAALGKPGVAIYGPTDPARHGPYGNSMRVLRIQNATTTYKRRSETDPSMKAIQPDDVWEALRLQLCHVTPL